MWNVKCEMWNVKCEMWNVKCEMWNVKCEMWKVKSEKWNVKLKWSTWLERQPYHGFHSCRGLRYFLCPIFTFHIRLPSLKFTIHIRWLRRCWSRVQFFPIRPSKGRQITCLSFLYGIALKKKKKLFSPAFKSGVGVFLIFFEPRKWHCYTFSGICRAEFACDTV